MSEIHHEGGSVRLEDLTRTLSELKKEKAAGEEVIAALAGRSDETSLASVAQIRVELQEVQNEINELEEKIRLLTS